MATIPRRMRAVADRLHDLATLAQRGCRTPRRARAVVDATLEQLHTPEADSASSAAQRSYRPLPICNEAEFTR